MSVGRDTLTITPDELQALGRSVEHIRNVCIVAHVDHGKTTLSDSLISTNGIISSRSAGKIRYLDHTKDEQERGITMKSSSISLLYTPQQDNSAAQGASVDASKYLINLIDSPGHMDFSSEVSSALRICDGCVVLVDVLEGVCIQTRAVLRQAWAEKVKPVLVLNKIDRLITQLYMTPQEAYDHMVKVLQQVNAVSGSLWAAEVMERKEQAMLAKANAPTASNDEGAIDEDLWDTLSDADVYFSPDRGNVVFASAYDGWGFRINHFADLYSKKWGVKKELLQKTLWGDYYFNPKTKKVYTKPFSKNAIPMAVQLVLNNIWEIYNAVSPVRDVEKLQKIAKALNIAVSNREMNHEDVNTAIQSVVARWLPVSRAVLDMVVEHLPNPVDAQKIRIPHLWKPIPVAGHEADIDRISADLQNCSSAADSSVVGFVSKVFAVPNDQLMLDMRAASGIIMPRPRGAPRPEPSEAQPVPAAQKQLERGGQSFIAMARLFSGVLRPGDTINLLGVRFNPAVSLEKHRAQVVVPQLYMLMGRSLQPLQEVRAGQVFGIGGDEVVSHIVKTTTISSVPFCTTFDSMKNKGNPIVRVAVEPENPSDLPKLEEGLKLLYLADPAVSTSVLDNGELVVSALGELHLHRCLSMLTEDFAKIKIKISPPIVSFRESVIGAQAREFTQDFVQETAERSVRLTLRARPLPEAVTTFLELNQDRTRRFIERLQGHSEVESSELFVEFAKELQELLTSAGIEWASLLSKVWAFGPKRVGPNVLVNSIPHYSSSPFWKSVFDKVTAAPLSIAGTTVVSPEGVESAHSQTALEYFYALQQLDNSIRAGFQLAAKAGPLCDEPMHGVMLEVLNVAFFDPSSDAISEKKKTILVDDDGFPISDDEGDDNVALEPSSRTVDPAEINKDNTASLAWADVSSLQQLTGRLSGFVISSMRQACREAFLRREQRLVEALYLTAVQTNSESMGKVYGVLSKRRAKILNEEVHEGSSIIVVMAYLPAVESFGFAEELFRKTSGAASAQLEFSHWEILDEDPNFVPTTEEELEEFGDNVGGIAPNLARKHIDAVRRRKGLPVKEKKVAAPDKQRTLAKKK